MGKRRGTQPKRGFHNGSYSISVPTASLNEYAHLTSKMARPFQHSLDVSTFLSTFVVLSRYSLNLKRVRGPKDKLRV